MTNKKPERKTDQIYVKCTPTEKRLWNQAAEFFGHFTPEWIRRTLNKEARKAKK